MKNYKGKYFSIYGDSLSTLQGYNPVQNDVFYFGERCEQSGVKDIGDTWWGQVIEKLGGKLLKNNSWSGCLVTNPFNLEVASCGCDDRRLTSLSDGEINLDVIIIFMGTNDRGGVLPLGKAGEKSITNFYGAYAYMLKRLKELYPATEIWCMTFRCQDMYNSAKGGNYIDSYSQAVRECTSKFGCKLIDLFNYPPYDVYDSDNIHADKQGMNDIATIVLQEVNKFV